MGRGPCVAPSNRDESETSNRPAQAVRGSRRCTNTRRLVPAIRMVSKGVVGLSGNPIQGLSASLRAGSGNATSM
jgi:hypothetical protein